MRLPSAFRRREDASSVAMTPMIDVVFMLLIFFVWTASFQVAELILPSSLISEQTEKGNTELDPEFEDLERVVVRLLWNDNQLAWTVNDVAAPSFDAVRSRLVAVARIKNSLPVLVDPDALVPLGHVIDVYDAAPESGFEKVQFAAPAP